MSNYVNMDTLRFQLMEAHAIEDLFKFDRFKDYDVESFNILLDAIKDFSDKELYPVFREMDRKPAYWEDGKIIAHPVIKKAIEKTAEMGLIGGNFDHEVGGLQMPDSMLNAVQFIVAAANNNIDGYPGLTSGAAHLIAEFGSQELKDYYLPKMMGGEWSGTMCLTEPQAGSSLSDITTSAEPNDDGSYNITGQKIFISGGDHEYSDNFVHLVLARIKGAPAGTKGISLFVVPKHKQDGKGGLVYNNVKTVADFQKLGQRGYCTTHLAFGEGENTTGWLVGQEHKGLKYMFLMMNGARIAVGRTGTAIASAAYHASLQYANERVQGRKIENSGKKAVDAEPIPIIRHADVRRMLMLQKSIYEGALSLIVEASKLYDIREAATGVEKDNANLLLELLTPIVKTFPSESGKRAVDNGVQILGGYGFCEDFVLQQYYRDIRITAIYEGTTGIQSLDLLGRKIPMQGGAALGLLVQEITKEITTASKYPDLTPYGAKLSKKMEQVSGVLAKIQPFAMEGNYERFLADASIFMEMFSVVVIGWQWLKMANVAKHNLVVGKGKYASDFYESKIETMKFYYQYEMSRVTGMVEVFDYEENLTIIKEKELIQ